MSRVSKQHYVLTHFPEVMTANPYEDRMLINKIKRSLYMAGYYKKDADANFDAVTNMIKKIQGNFKQSPGHKIKRK
jgi:RNAse (barnase) inhibitor barstar